MLGMTKRPNQKPSSLSWNERIKGLPPKRQELIRPVLQDPRAFLFLSIRALAEKLGSDTATTLRAVRGMGFSGYPEFRRYIHELTIAHQTSLDAMLTGSTHGSDILAHVRGSLQQDQKNLVALGASLDAKRLVEFAKHVWAARRIVLLGGDLASCLVAYLAHHLLMLGLPAFSATSTAEVINLVRAVGPKDLVIAISYHRGLRQTVEGVRQARANGAYCVGITDTFVSPVARFANECFITSAETAHFGDSYVAAMALCNVMLVACADFRRARALTLARESADEQRRGYRWCEEQIE
jgi:DNA-binding MurR/RpiR family transcriptional regulator